MEQGGFDFRKPSERREARRFEPPPWEQDAFKELRQKREAENESNEEPPKAARPEAAVEPAAQGEKPGQIDEARMIELMAGLSSETPRAKSAATSVTLGFGGLLAVFGLGFVLWGGVIIARTQGSGRTLALVLVVMGLAYLAVGAGLGYRALKERGVL